MQHISEGIARLLAVYQPPKDRPKCKSWVLYQDGTRKIIWQETSETPPIEQREGCHWECIGEVV